MKLTTMKMKMKMKMPTIRAIAFWASLALALILTQKLAIFLGKLIVDLFYQG